MTQVCSLPSSTADVNATCHSKRLPKGIHIIGADTASDPRVGGMSGCEERAGRPSAPEGPSALPWGYIFIHHLAAGVFDRRLAEGNLRGDYCPRCFIHRTVHYRRRPDGRGVVAEQKPTVSGLVFLQGTTRQLKSFLIQNFPQYYLVNNCSTGRPASIPDSVMQPFMVVMDREPDRVTFLRDPFVRFAAEHVRLRVLTGLFAGQEGYVVRINRDRQLVMDIGGYAVAISHVHNEDFEVAE